MEQPNQPAALKVGQRGRYCQRERQYCKDSKFFLENPLDKLDANLLNLLCAQNLPIEAEQPYFYGNLMVSKMDQELDGPPSGTAVAFTRC